MSNKTVAVTGAGGFIGSHLCEALVHTGHRVKALVEYNSFNDIHWLADLAPDILSQIEITAGDIRDADCCNRFIEGSEWVFHLAALIAIPYSYKAPRAYVDTNVTGSLNVLQACLNTEQLERVIMTSTSEVYGTAQFVPITETHPLRAQSPYAASKIAADQLADSFYRSYDLPVAILRPFNTFGPRQSMRAVIPTIIQQALTGDSIEVGNLSPRRDFNYIDDTVNGFIKIAQAPESVLGETIQIGRGYDVSIEDVINTVSDILGRKLTVIESNERLRPEKSEVFRLCASIDRAKTLLDYAPQVTLFEGLQKSITWFENRSQSGLNERLNTKQYVI